MGLAEFINQLKDLGVDVGELGGDKIALSYVIPCGRFKGQTIKLGFHTPPDFPFTPPSGPHISPHLLPINESAPAHPDRVHHSDFGSEWQYWSRTFPKWTEITNKTVKNYMKYIQHLFETQ